METVYLAFPTQDVFIPSCLTNATGFVSLEFALITIEGWHRSCVCSLA